MAHPTDLLVVEAVEEPAACVLGEPPGSKPVDALLAAMAFDLKVQSNGEVDSMTGSVAAAVLKAHDTAADELDVVRDWRAMLPALGVGAAVLNRSERVEPVVSVLMILLDSGWHCAPSHGVVGAVSVVWGGAEAHWRNWALDWELEIQHLMVTEVVEEGSVAAAVAVGSVWDEGLVARSRAALSQTLQ
jgi:hypothetical protein